MMRLMWIWKIFHSNFNTQIVDQNGQEVDREKERY